MPFAAPGDLARVRIDRTGRRVDQGAIEALLEPSPERREPACPVFGACGGCHLQHVTPRAQLAAKVEAVRDALRRIGRIPWPGEIPIDAGAEYGWRSRTELHVEPGRVGYFRAHSRELVPIDDCPILVPALRAEVRRLAASPPDAGPESGRMALAAGDDGEVARGEEPFRQRILGLDYRFLASAFSQGNRALVETLVRRATAGSRGSSAVDLYAGAGLFALALAGSFALVHAVESEASAARLLVENAAANRIGNVRAFAGSVERWLRDGETPASPDLVLLDPSRAGAGPEVVAGIAALDPARVAYVSCDPTTLARDLADFLARGFVIESIVALDLFPQSYHVEVVAHLERARPATEDAP